MVIVWLAQEEAPKIKPCRSLVTPRNSGGKYLTLPFVALKAITVIALLYRVDLLLAGGSLSLTQLVLHFCGFVLYFFLLVGSTWAWAAVVAINVLGFVTSILAVVSQQEIASALVMENAVMLVLLYVNRHHFLGDHPDRQPIHPTYGQPRAYKNGLNRESDEYLTSL